MMKLSLQYRGRRFDIYAIVLNNGVCPAVDFRDMLKRNNIASYKSLVRIFTLHADYGPVRNITKSRAIKGRQNLFEFKSKQGDRLLYFYLSGHRTILIHGFHKGVSEEAEYDRAERIRNQYLKEVGDDRK